MGLFGPSEKDIANKVYMVVNFAIAGALGPNYKLPEHARDDDFLIGYMLGALYNGYHHGGIVSAKKQYKGAVYYFEMFFPGEGRAIIDSCQEQMTHAGRDPNDTLQHAAHCGMKETSEIIGGNGEADRLRDHLEKHYAG